MCLYTSSPVVSISQTGLIPAGSQSLFFERQTSANPGPLDISIGNQNIPFTAVGTGPNYTPTA